MEKDIRLRMMYCPQCAAVLKIADESKKRICPYCERPIRPTPTVVNKPHPSPSADLLPRTPAAALSYAKYFFEDLDWNARLFLPAVSVTHTDALLQTFLQIGAEDALTWQLAFECAYTPAFKKAEGLLSAQHKAEQLYISGKTREAQYLFDSLRDCLLVCKEQFYGILQNLLAITEQLRRCGTQETELRIFCKKADALRSIVDSLEIPQSIEELPAVQTELENRNKELSDRLAEIGIDAEAEYRKIGTHLAQKQYTDALATMQRIAGYKNTNALAAEVCRFYNFRDVLQIAGQLYMYAPNDKSGCIYSVENGKPSAEPVLKGVAKILVTYGSRLFWLDSKNRLQYFDFSDKMNYEFDRKQSFPGADVYRSDSVSEIYISCFSKEGKGPRKVSKFELDAIKETVLAEDISQLHAVRDGLILYTDTKSETFVTDIKTAETRAVCRGRIDLCAVNANRIIYTRNAPSADNKNLYVFTAAQEGKEELLAANILDFCGIQNDLVYFTVGNQLQKSLLCTDVSSGVKKQIIKYADEITLAEDGRVYVICGDAYNRVLYGICPKTLKKKQICDQVQSVLRVYCANIFYIDTDYNLCCVQTDGNGQTVLFADTEKVLLWNDHTVYFTAADDVFVSQDVTGATRVNKHISLYGIATDGSLLQKIACGIADAQIYNEKEIDFFKCTTSANGSTAKWLFRFDTESAETFKLLEYHIYKKGK